MMYTWFLWKHAQNKLLFQKSTTFFKIIHINFYKVLLYTFQHTTEFNIQLYQTIFQIGRNLIFECCFLQLRSYFWCKLFKIDKICILRIQEIKKLVNIIIYTYIIGTKDNIVDSLNNIWLVWWRYEVSILHNITISDSETF